MALTKFRKFRKSAGPAAVPEPEHILLVCLLVLPYASYVALIAMAGLTVWAVIRYGQAIGQQLARGGWLLLGGGMAITAVTAQNSAEAGLQLANFLPFFLFFGVLKVWIERLQRPVETLESWALALVVGSIPISLRAALEYYLKAPTVAARYIDSGRFEWLYSQVDYGHRANSVFGHPNVLAAYLVVILGLGLGLSLRQLRGGKLGTLWPWRFWPLLLTSAIALALVGIFCSGSRNGVLAAIAQLLIFGWLMRRNRWVALTGLAGISAVLTAVVAWGIGGRSVGEAVTSTSLRMDVWRLSLDLIRHHPWLGLGLGGFKLSYVPYTIPQYDSVEHAHNLWLMLAAEVGIPLMLLFSALVGRFCYVGTRTLLQHSLPTADAAVLTSYGLAFLGCIVFALFDVTFYDARVNVLGWLTLAAIAAMPALATAQPAAQQIPQPPQSP